MKKPLCLILALIFLSALLFGCAAESLPVHVEGAVFGGNSNDSIPVELSFDVRWLTEGDNTVYNAELARFSALLCADVYFREKDLAKGTQNRVLIDGSDAALYTPTALLTKLGFSDVRYIESFKLKEYALDTNDSVTLTAGYLDYDDTYDVFVIALRGCFSVQEWLSVFDPGAAEGSYSEYTGEHPEWTDTRRYKGAGIAANRAEELINAFISENDAPERENVILVTGHSRGGILANMIGADMELNSNAKTFTYTFSTMPVTTDTEAPGYKTVFNIFDPNDYYVNTLPFGNESFFRYGRDISLSLNASDEALNALDALKGRDGYADIGPDAISEYKELFGKKFPERASLYDTLTLTERFSLESEANARFDEMQTLIGANGLGLDTFVSAAEPVKTADGSYEVTLSYCGGALLWGYSKTLAYGAPAYDAFISLFKNDEAACRIADFLAANAGAITSGHLLANTYILSGFGA